MIADPEKSLEYFQSAPAGDEDDAEFGTTLTPISTPADYDAAIASPGPVVVRTFLCGTHPQVPMALQPHSAASCECTSSAATASTTVSTDILYHCTSACASHVC